MNTQEVADYFGVSYDTIVRWTLRKHNQLACLYMGNRRKFKREHILAFEEECANAEYKKLENIISNSSESKLNIAGR